jgi:hypothetical protein
LGGSAAFYLKEVRRRIRQQALQGDLSTILLEE